MANERTEINTLGEFGLIRRLTQEIKHQQSSTLLGVGDDAAVIELALVAERVSKITRANPGLKVLVEGDATIAYGRVIDLMDRLQRVGVQDVGLITQPPSG